MWCILCAPALAAAAPTGENAPLDLQQAQEASSGGGGGLARTIVGLAIVVGVIFGLHWVLKQVKSSREEKVSGEGLATLATLPLGPNRAVHVVRAGNEVLVLGATEHGIAQLRTYREEEAIEAGLIGAPGAAAGEPEVIDVTPRPRLALPSLAALQRVTGGARNGNGATPSGAAPNGTNMLDTLRAWTVRR